MKDVNANTSAVATSNANPVEESQPLMSATKINKKKKIEIFKIPFPVLCQTRKYKIKVPTKMSSKS